MCLFPQKTTHSIAEQWQRIVVKIQIVIVMAPATGIALRTRSQVKDESEAKEKPQKTGNFSENLLSVFEQCFIECLVRKSLLFVTQYR